MSRAVASGLIMLGLSISPLGNREAVALPLEDPQDEFAGLVADDPGYLDERIQIAQLAAGGDVSGCGLLPCIFGFSSLSDTSGAAGDGFGSAVAHLATDTSGNIGDLLIVGAPGRIDPIRRGAAYLFARANYGWIKQVEISTSSSTAGGQFGLSVGATRNFVDGPLVAIGGPSSDTSGFTDSGIYMTARAPFLAPHSYGFSLVQTFIPTTVGARFGETVDVDNLTLAVAVPGLNRVTVFTRGAPWTVEDQLPVPLGAGPASGYGSAMDLSGNLIAVGAPLADDAGAVDSGAVYLFRRNAGVWTNETKLIDPSGRTGDGFGQTVAVSGNVVVVGAPGAPGVGGALGAGRAYVFALVGSQWLLRSTLFAPDGAPGDGFGRFVTMKGDRIIIGAPGDDFGVHTDRGSGYFFLRAGEVYPPVAKLIAPEFPGLNRSSDQLGFAGALTSTEAVLGAPGAKLFSAGAAKGVVMVFPLSYITPREVPREAEASDANDNTGASTATAGDWLVAGTPNDDFGGDTDRGSINFYQRVGETWELKQTMSPALAEASDRVGRAVGMNNNADLVLVGAPGTDVGAGAGQGAAYFYSRSGDVWSEGSRVINPAGLPGDGFGASIAVAPDGDVMVVGAALEANSVGAVYVLRNPVAAKLAGAGLADSWKQAAADSPTRIVRTSGTIGDKFGESVALTFDGMAVGAPGVNDGEGAASIYQDEAGGFALAVPELVPSIPNTGDKPAFGSSIALSDAVLAVGAPEMDFVPLSGQTRTDQGSVSLFSVALQTQTYVSPPTVVTAATGTFGDKFGSAVGATNDTVAVGAPETTVSREQQSGDNQGGVVSVNDQGGVYTFQGTKPGLTQFEPLTWDQDAFITAENGAALDEFGTSVTIRPGRLVIGVPMRDGVAGEITVSDAGTVYVFEDIAVDTVFREGFE